MKNKITVKLALYFSAALLLFSLVIGSVFAMLFQNHTIEVHKVDLERRAATIAATLSDLIADINSGRMGPGMGSMGSGQARSGAYLRFLDDIAMADVWIVDENLTLLSSPITGRTYNYGDLPEDAEAVVKEVFLGSVTFSEGFSDLLKVPTLTVGTPIFSEGRVVGALLLHSPVEGAKEATAQGIRILIISISMALFISVLLSVIFARAFTKPLRKMKDTAILLATGDYAAKTGVYQKDEIGELASSLDVLSQRLEQAREETEKLENLRRGFIANISHELRTPVTVIRGSLEALCDGVVTQSEQVDHYHRQMLNESLFLERLVNDLLDLSRLQNSDFQIDIQNINLCDVLTDAVRSIGQMAVAKNIDIRLSLDPQVLMTHGDYGRLRQMLLIILDNAVKFSSKGQAVIVSLKENTVTIRDYGSGISELDLPYIFDRFYKVKSEENKNGSGLGLSIAKQIADRHGIGVSVSSKMNEGTEFQFRFPAEG